MLIPRFTIRWLLVLTTLCGVIALVLSLAVSGRVLAIAFVLALASGVLAIAVHAVFFCMALGAAKLVKQSNSPGRSVSPFATHTLPPQLLRSDEPE